MQSPRSTFKSTLNVIAGVVKEGDTNQMTRLLYRISRGKVVSFFTNIGTVSQAADKGSSSQMGAVQPVSYAAYVLVFADSDYLMQKVHQIAQNFSLNTY